MTVKMTEIEEAARGYAADARSLRSCHEEFEAQVEELKTKHMPIIIELTKKAAESKQLLLMLVTDAPSLFDKPKTQIISGVKVGFIKQKGKLEVPNVEATIRILRSDYKEIAPVAIKIKEELVKETLSSLSGDDLKKLGIAIIADSDKPVVALTDSALEKMINKIMAEQMKLAE